MSAGLGPLSLVSSVERPSSLISCRELLQYKFWAVFKKLNNAVISVLDPILSVSIRDSICLRPDSIVSFTMLLVSEALSLGLPSVREATPAIVLSMREKYSAVAMRTIRPEHVFNVNEACSYLVNTSGLAYYHPVMSKLCYTCSKPAVSRCVTCEINLCMQCTEGHPVLVSVNRDNIESSDHPWSHQYDPYNKVSAAADRLFAPQSDGSILSMTDIDDDEG